MKEYTLFNSKMEWLDAGEFNNIMQAISSIDPEVFGLGKFFVMGSGYRATVTIDVNGPIELSFEKLKPIKPTKVTMGMTKDIIIGRIGVLAHDIAIARKSLEYYTENITPDNPFYNISRAIAKDIIFYPVGSSKRKVDLMMYFNREMKKLEQLNEIIDTLSHILEVEPCQPQ